jgi:hypothetical protein
MEPAYGILLFVLVVLAACGGVALIAIADARRRARLTAEQRADEDKELEELFYW